MDQRVTGRRLSAEAWTAMGVVGAAVITGVVTLVVHLTPSADKVSTASSRPPVVPPAASTGAPAGPSTVDAMAGSWEGNARDSAGTRFRISLTIQKGCTRDRACGSIGVSHVPCYGQVFVENVDNGEVEFRVANFDERSDKSTCQPGAGEFFRLQPDGSLAYRTAYEPTAKGTLHRT